MRVDQRLQKVMPPGFTTAPPQGAPKYLLFRLGDARFGIDVMRVREIVAMHPLTAIPNAPPALCGVINQRGRVVPVVDLRVRLDMSAREFDARTCLIVVESDDDLCSALAVDAVYEVAEITPDEIEPTPSVRGQRPPAYMRGVARIDDSVTVVLDVEELWSPAGGELRAASEHLGDS